METNGSFKINEDITMNSNFDRVWRAGTLTAHTDTQTQTLTYNIKKMTNMRNQLDDEQKTKKSRNRERRGEKNDDCGGSDDDYRRRTNIS